jgi:ABC-2 type transport system permease protein
VKLVLVHARAMTVELVRYPAFSVPTLGFPALFFLLFVSSRPEHDATLLLASFAGFAFLAVALFQFGVGVAAERETPWEQFLRTLPLRVRVRFAARVLSGTLFGLASAALVALTAVATTDAHLASWGWASLVVILVIGAVPFGFLGIALGYWTSPRGALPIANVLYLLLAFAGGLWTTPARLPSAVAAVSPLVPTRQFGDVLRGAAEGRLWQPHEWLVLTAWGVAFAALAVWGYSRDEGRRYG